VSLPAAINETNTGYQQAAAALKICKDNDLAQNITFFDPFDLRNVLTDPKMISHFNHYYEKYLKPIEEYDSAHEGTLMKTMRMYFEKNREIKPCAMRYSYIKIRFAIGWIRISQIANIDFNDRNTS
jgi:sugar diacid utilization regulator